MKTIVVAITGASGSIYGVRLVEELLAGGCRVTLLVSATGREVLKHETGLDLPVDAEAARSWLRTRFCNVALDYYGVDDLFAPVASGSSAPDAVVIVPASMGSIGRIAAGMSGNLIERVADVALKEGKTLLVVPRESPFNLIHLRNLVTLAEAGARIIPPSPAFYQKPETLADLVDFVVGKCLDSLGIKHELFTRWGDKTDQP